MTFEVSFNSTAPKKGEAWWQFDLLPSLGMMRYNSKEADLEEEFPEEEHENYYVFNLQWLFWSLSLFVRK